MYLYTPFDDDEDAIVKQLPEALLKLTGQLVKTMDLELTEDRKLARADVKEVISSLKEKGYYLQSPPNEVLRRDDGMLNNSSDGF